MNQRFISLIVMIGLLAASCNGSGLQRTSTKRWEIKTFYDEGMSLTIPTASKVNHHPSFGVSVWLHPLAPPWYRMQDTQYFVIVAAQRKDGRSLQEERESLARNVQRTEDSEFQFWSAGEHPTIDVIPEDVYSYYRYDVKCGRGEVLRLKAEVRHPIVNGSPKFQTEDDAIVRRILNSAKCLER